MIGFGQTREHRDVEERGIYYIGEGQYKISKMSGMFSLGTTWVPKMKRRAKKDIKDFGKLVRADSYKIVKENIRPTHSGGGNNTFGRIDITFVLLEGESVRLYDSNVLKGDIKHLELTNETDSSLTAYYDSNILHDIEGIYKSTSKGGNSYTIGIKKYGRLFKAVIINSNYPHWKTGEVKAIFNLTATSGVFSCTYYTADKKEVELFVIVENIGLLNIEIDKYNTANFVKMYPINTGVSNGVSSGEWSGNGSGFFISQNGYIVTNHHVIEKASEIEVEFEYRNEIKEFSAKVIQTDPTNDLAILKIDDDDFSNVGALPYTFRTRSVDVGTDVFALGYPKALTIMGKEIKFTDGRISSKTGFKGDITTYQSTTPIQPGNSGGPLFDFKGNLIGINNAKIITEDVEGVSYSIKSSYLLNLIDVLPETIPLPSSTQLASKPLTEQIKILSDYVVLIKVK
tara:strand:- start:341 stop:1708 length:1368 start_codon:yes stop_codon:yes gene_type:complete